MSGVLDLRTQDYDDASELIEPTLDACNDSITALNTQLSKDLNRGIQMFTLSCDGQIGKASQSGVGGNGMPESTPMLRLVSHLATLIERGNIPVSESETVALWKLALEILSEGRLKLISGEKICQATLASKREFKEIFSVEGETDSGRKVDLLLKVGDLEVLNTEAKATNNEALCDEQYKKNIRINHAIYIIAKKQGIELPSMLPLYIRGFFAMVCHLKKAGDNVFVAGAAVSRMITLPKNKEELHTFLEGPSSRIL
ncbi:hypothetical protein BGX27_002231 [Mortierella sp. AM989]|nr:hypothetical protein BGX27_002231 [Mortierella sp. AM989]